jgi:hypothetical protein
MAMYVLYKAELDLARMLNNPNALDKVIDVQNPSRRSSSDPALGIDAS